MKRLLSCKLLTVRQLRGSMTWGCSVWICDFTAVLSQSSKTAMDYLLPAKGFGALRRNVARIHA
jgi:hypothetical protein